MKKTIILALACFAAVLQGQSQTDAIARFFGQYENREDVTNISVTGKLFQMASQFEAESEQDKDFKRMVSQIQGLRMIVDSEDADARNTATEARKKVLRDFEDLVTIKEKNTQVNVLVDEANGIVSEILVIVGSDSSFVIASLTGKMLLSDVGKLTSQMSQMSSDLFEKSTVTPMSIEVYPNPVRSGEQITVNLPAELEGADVRIFSASGSQVSSYKAQRSGKRLDTSKLAKGTYVLKAEKGSTTATIKFIVN